MIRMLATAITLAMLSLPVAAAETAQPAPEPAKDVASASVVQGAVQVNRGEAFLPLRVGQALKEGDRVMALRAGSATLRFDNGCELVINPDTLVVVPNAATCACASRVGRVKDGDIVASSADVIGQVQVDQGRAFLPLSSGAPLQAGDRVKALTASSATIKFEDGRCVKVKPETTVTVQRGSMCGCPLLIVQSLTPASSEAIGAVAAAGAADTSGAALIAGAVLVGGAVLFRETDKKPKKTKSP